MEEFVCQHQKVMAWCKLHDCEECKFKGHERDCPFAKNMAGDTMPTFREAIAAYRAGSASRVRKDAVERSVVNSLKVMGLTPDAKMIAMGYTQFEQLAERLTAPDRPRGPLRPTSLESVIGAFKAICHTTVSYVKYLRGISRDPFAFAIPEFEFKRAKKQTVTVAQARKVVISMERLFATGRQSDRNAALYIFFALFMQMRGGDICNLKWDDIKITPAGVFLVYTPHKTIKTSDEPVSIRLEPMEYEVIRPYIRPGEWVIPRHENRVGKGTLKHGEYVGLHKYTRRIVSGVCKEAGIGLEYPQQKKGHALRKFRETMVAALMGVSEAARRSHHSEAVAKRSYIGSEYSLVAG